MTIKNRLKKVIAFIAAATMCSSTMSGYVSAAGLTCDTSDLFTFEVELEEVTTANTTTKNESKAKLNKSSLTMFAGATYTLRVTGIKNTAAWTSTNTTVCTVNKNGKVTAKKAGTAKIIAKVGGKTLYCKVKVVSSSISSTADKTINKGEKTTVSLKSNNVKAVTAYSSDSNIVKVTNSSVSNGTIKVGIKAISDGTAYITVADKNNSSASAKFKVTVNAPANTSSNSNDNSAGGIRIQVIDNGDGTTSFRIIQVDTDNSGSSADYAEEMLDLVNAERKKAGVSALVLDDELCKAAQVRAKEVGVKFSHTRPDGSDCFTILKSYAVSCVYAGENIAQGSSTCSGAMKQWMNSPGHKGNILRSGWTKMGVGYDSETNSWVQIFTD